MGKSKVFLKQVQKRCLKSLNAFKKCEKAFKTFFYRKIYFVQKNLIEKRAFGYSFSMRFFFY